MAKFLFIRIPRSIKWSSYFPFDNQDSIHSVTEYVLDKLNAVVDTPDSANTDIANDNIIKTNETTTAPVDSSSETKTSENKVDEMSSDVSVNAVVSVRNTAEMNV